MASQKDGQEKAYEEAIAKTTFFAGWINLTFEEGILFMAMMVLFSLWRE